MFCPFYTGFMSLKPLSTDIQRGSTTLQWTHFNLPVVGKRTKATDNSASQAL